MREIRFLTVVDCRVATDSWRFRDSAWNTREAGMWWYGERDPGSHLTEPPGPWESLCSDTEDSKGVGYRTVRTGSAPRGGWKEMGYCELRFGFGDET